MNSFRLNDPGDAADPNVTVTLFRVSVAATCLWSLVQSYWEIGASETTMQLAALISAKVIVAILGAASIIRGGWPRISFTFLCGVSVIAIASSLPSEWLVSRDMFALSAVDCVCRLSVVVWYLALPTGGNGPIPPDEELMSPLLAEFHDDAASTPRRVR